MNGGCGGDNGRIGWNLCSANTLKVVLSRGDLIVVDAMGRKTLEDLGDK